MEITLRFDFEDLLPRPELMPPNGREILLLYLQRKIPQYEAAERLGWKQERFTNWLATIAAVSKREFDPPSKENIKAENAQNREVLANGLDRYAEALDGFKNLSPDDKTRIVADVSRDIRIVAAGLRFEAWDTNQKKGISK